MAVGVHAGSAYVDIQGDLRPLRRDLAAAGGPMGRQMGKLGGQLGSQLTRALGAGVKVGAVAVAGGLVYAVKKAADFEGQLSSLGAVSDASGKQMETLRKQALKAGADTKFSALEAAQAQTELAKGGLKVSQIMRGGLKSSLALAAAGELDLATAAETTVNAMKLFDLHGKDSMQVADALATAANKTTADVEDFAMALKMGGSVAKLAGLDLQQTVTILESLAEAGIKNSDAGTSLKSFFLNIATPSAKAKEAMKELGVELFDAQGNLKSLPAIAENLRGAFGHLTREQFLNKAGTIAGSDAIRTLYSLYAAGPDKLRGFEKGLNKQGTAVEVARKKQDNLKGSLEQLRGSAETFGITVGSEMIPAIRGGADELTDFTNKLSKIVQRDDLDVGEKLSKSFELAKVEATPWIHKLEKALDEADIPEHLGDAVSAATPVIAEHLAKAAPKAANAFFDAWRGSDVWGKLVIGGFLLHKMGGFAAFRALGTKTGAAYGTAMGTSAATAAAPGLARTAASPVVAGGFGKKGPQAPVFGPAGPQAPAPPRGRGAATLAGAAAAGQAVTGRLKGMAPQVRQIGKGTLAVALVAGLADGLTSEGTWRDRLQNAISSASFGIVPGSKELSDQMAGSVEKALQGVPLHLKGMKVPGSDWSGFFDSLGSELPGKEKEIVQRLRHVRETAQNLFGRDTKLRLDVSADPAKATRQLRMLSNEFGRMKQGSILSVKELRSVSQSNFKAIAETMGVNSKSGREALQTNFRLSIRTIRDFRERGVLNVAQAGGEIKRLMKLNSGQGADALAANMLKAEKAIARTMSKGGKITEQGTALIRALMVNAMKDMGLSPDTIRMSLNKRESAKHGPVTPGQTGMVVTGGKPSGDSVHALLERGEVVINSKAVQKMGGPQAVNTINKVIPRFQTGGIAGMVSAANQLERAHFDYLWGGGHQGSPAPFGPMDCSGAVSYVLQHGGIRIPTMTSGLLAGAGQPGPGKVTVFANPTHTFMRIGKRYFGTSGTNTGGGAGWFDDPGSSYRSGFAQRHFAAAGGVFDKVPRLTVDAPESMVKTMVQGALDKTRSGANKKLKDVSSTAFGGGDVGDPGPLGEVKGNGSGLMKKIAKQFGWSFPDWWALDAAETSHGANLANPTSSARLRGQFLDMNYGKYGPGSDPAQNPSMAQQIWSMAKYIKARYGNPTKAWAFHQGHNFYAKGGVVGYAGDSLGVGTVPKLRGLLDRKIDANVLSGRSSSSGLAAIREMARKSSPGEGFNKHAQYVFDLGTNDGSAGQLSSSLKAADKATGRRPLHALTVLGPDAGKKNAALRALVGGDIDLVDWAKVAGQYVGSDPQKIHPNDDGYQRRAQMIATAIRKAGEKEELSKGQRKQIRGAGHGTLGQQFAQTIKSLKHLSAHTKFGKLMRNKRVHSLADKLKGFGVLPGHLDDKIRILTGGVDEYGDYADLASQLNVDNEDGTTSLGAFRGHDEPFWLKGQLSRLWSLRNFLADAQKILNDRREQLAAMAARVRKLVHQTQAQIGELVDRRHALEKRLVQLKKNPKVNRKLIDETEFSLKQTKQTLSNKVGTRKDLNRVLGDSDHGLLGTRAKMGTALSETVVPGLEAVQGKGGPQGRLSALPALGTLGGSLFDVQFRLRDLAAPTTATVDTDSPVTGESAEQLRQLLREANLRTAVSEKGFDVLRDFQSGPPFGGSFKDGGVVPGPIGAPRTAIVHGGETVTPVGADGPRVRVVVEDHRTRVFVDDVEQVVEGVVRSQTRRAGRQLVSRGGGVLR